MPNEFSVRLVPAKMAGVVSPRGGGRGGSLHVKSLDKCDFSDFDPQNRRSPRKLYQTT